MCGRKGVLANKQFCSKDCEDKWKKQEYEDTKHMLLKNVNPRIASEFIQLKGFCSYESYEFDILGSIALKEKKSNRIYCFKYYDFLRGRGKVEECDKEKCPFFCFVDSRQRKITDYLDNEKGGEIKNGE